MIPKISAIMSLAGFVFVVKAVVEWIAPSTDEVRFFLWLGFALGGLYIAYDQWKKSLTDNKLEEMEKDVAAIDKKANSLETKLIKLTK